MPFAGDRTAARVATESLLELRLAPGDELILSDNSGSAPPADGVNVVRATSERSPAHARNVGAERARCEWILFIDADCRAPRDLIDAFFAQPVAEEVGVLAGEVVPGPGADTLAARYGATRSFLSQEAHLAHPYLPRAVAANLLVRRAAFEQVGGFFEGVRAAEDTDFSWRIQRAGWRIELRPRARVEHRYRASLPELRRQWRGYAAGRAWLARRYEGFTPEPAVRRAVRRTWRWSPWGRRRARRTATRRAAPARHATASSRVFRALDVLLAAEELAGLTLSNRPPARRPPRGEAEVVLVADRFPSDGDPLAELARTLRRARVEAAARPDAPDPTLSREIQVAYREDDGKATRMLALARLVVRHPLRSAVDLIRRQPGEPRLAALAPAVLRLRRDPHARVHPLGSVAAHRAGRRLAALAGRRLEAPRR
ncbi:MAG: glycosyltransferase [Solirubrobacterales bacterium]|nr:glycosyltransferase [Solirubrobacterales bacterium]MBV9472134.1 glycosyltransferase [Solirubrobacterales bacterium]